MCQCLHEPLIRCMRTWRCELVCDALHTAGFFSVDTACCRCHARGGMRIHKAQLRFKFAVSRPAAQKLGGIAS